MNVTAAGAILLHLLSELVTNINMGGSYSTEEVKEACDEVSREGPHHHYQQQQKQQKSGKGKLSCSGNNGQRRPSQNNEESSRKN